MTWARIPRWHPLVLVSLALSAWVYFPITRVYFHADDLLHLLTIADEGPLAFILKPFGGHALLASNVMFVASYELFGLRSEAYYWVVLLTHLLNVSLLFATLHAFTRSALLACFGAALWGTSPLAVGTIGWYSVYGHAMVATILLIVLGQLTRLVASDSPLTTRTAGLWYVLLLLGVVSFGTGIGVAFAFPAVLFLLMPSAWRRPGLRAIWITLPLVTLAVYFVARRAYLLIAPVPVTELLGEVMVWNGVYALPPDVAHMLGFAVASVVLGFFRPPYPSPGCWAAIGAFCAGVALVVWRGGWQARRSVLAMVLLATSTYAVIALGRAALYAGLHIPPWAVAGFERYHYVATIPVVVLLCLALQQVGRLVGGPAPLLARLALIAGLGAIVVGRLQSPFRINEHMETRYYVSQTLRDIEAAVAAQPPGTTVFLANEESPTIILGALKNPAFPGRAAVFLITHPSSDMLNGRRVRFVEPDHQLLAMHSEGAGTRLAPLLVAPEDLPAQP